MSFDSLIRKAGVGDSAKYEGYYEGKVHLDSLGISIPPQARVLERVAPFPKLAIDVLAEVLNPEGFILGGNRKIPELLRKWWQANDLDTEVKLAIVEALVAQRAFFIVGPGDAETPRITAHRPAGMAVAYDRMGRVSEAVRRYRFGDDKFAAHYVPGENRYYGWSGGRWVPDGSPTITRASRPAVVPMVNKARLGDVDGRSEIAEIAKATDAGSRTLTNIQVAQEVLTMPTKYLFGDGLEAMRDQNGDPVDKITAYFGQFLTGPAGSSAGTIAGASLQEFINTYKMYAQEVSSITGIPPSMLGISTDNPSSAEAMRTAKERLIAKAEVKQAMFGDALEDVAKLALEMEGRTPANVETLELQWRDPALTSVSAKSANMLQAHAQGVITAQTARDGLQLSPEQKAREDARSGDVARMAQQLGTP